MTRYTSYDYEEKRFCVRCLYNPEGGQITFSAKHEPGDIPSIYGEVIDRLAEYENIGLTPEEICDLIGPINQRQPKKVKVRRRLIR